MKKRIFITLLTVALAIVMVIPTTISAVANGATNLIVNGDFESGNTGFSTDFNYVPAIFQNSLGDPGVYSVGTNPNSYHSAWASFGDHTSTSGKMMIVNGYADGSNPVVWGQDVTLTDYVNTYPVTTVTLYAGQTWDIGDVLVKTSTTGVCVKFVLTDAQAISDGWLITEAHVAVANDCLGIPQKNGNPIPGQFPINGTNDGIDPPGVTETGWYCPDYPAGYNYDDPLCVAAHAKVQKLCQLGQTVTVDIVSGAGTDNVLLLAEDGSNPGYPVGYTAPFQSYSGTPTASVLAWTHNAWAPYGISGAEWISSAQYAETPDVNTWRLFTRSFTLPLDAFNISGTMTANCDNAEDVYLNGAFIMDGSPAVVYTASPPSGPAHGWSSVESWTATPQVGTNNLWIMTRNYGWLGGTLANPTALIYKLHYQYDIPTVYCGEETAWGDGNPFTGKNWATCITYTPNVVRDYGTYLLEFYARSTYLDNPAELQVKINAVINGTNLELTPSTTIWGKYSATWTAGSTGLA